MRVLFVSINKLKSYRPVLPIGMVTVATQARAAGHEVRCCDLMFEQDDEAAVRRATQEFQPEVVGISIRNVDSLNILEPAVYTPLALEVAEWARATQPNVRVLLGGAGFTTVPEDLMEFVGADWGLLGFAERSMLLLLERIENRQPLCDIPGLIVPSAAGFDRWEPEFSLNYRQVLPPDRSLYDPRYFSYAYETHDEVSTIPATIQTKKGCLLECTFCSNFLIDGTGVVPNAPNAVVDEIERLANEGFQAFEIVDGVFNLPLHHALDILTELARRKLRLPWSCMINPGAVNEKLVALMVETGCKEVELGTDSANDRVLASLKKNFRQSQVIKVHELFQSAGIKVMHCLFIGSPDDTADSVSETFDVMDELVPRDSAHSRIYWTFGLRICRGTALYQRALQDGFISGDERFIVPKYYVSPAVLHDEALLCQIQERVLGNPAWYLWWGLTKISLAQRLAMAKKESHAMEEMLLSTMARRRQARGRLVVL